MSNGMSAAWMGHSHASRKIGANVQDRLFRTQMSQDSTKHGLIVSDHTASMMNDALMHNIITHRNTGVVLSRFVL